MKKLTKLHAILILLFIGVLAVTVYFSFSYRGAEAKQPDTLDEIKLAQMRLTAAKEEKNPEPLKQELDKLQSELQSKLKILSQGAPLFPEQPATVDIGDLIIDTIEKLDLTLLKLKPNDRAGTITIKTDADSEGNKYNKAEYEVRVKGDLGRITSFIGEIEAADFATLILEDIEIEFYPEEEKEERTIPAWWEAQFTVVTLYQYEEVD